MFKGGTVVGVLHAHDTPVERAANAPEPSPWAKPESVIRDGMMTFGKAAACLAVTATVVMVGFHYITLADVAMLYLLMVMLAALVGRGLVLVAVPMAVIAINFVFMPPHYALGYEHAHSLLTVLIMLGAGVAIGALTISLRRKERRAAAMVCFTRDIAAASEVVEIAGAAVHHVQEIAGADAAVLTRVADQLTALAGQLTLSASELDMARWSLEHGAPAGRGTATTTSAALTMLPLRHAGETFGVLVVGRTHLARGIDGEQRRLLDALARQVGFALGRARLAVEAHDATLRARTEELRSSMLSLVSHDLRNPLAVIRGAATVLRDDAARVTAAAQGELLETIVHESGRLERVLQNLYAITRVETGLEPAREWVPVEELCGGALTRLGETLGLRRLQIDIPGDLLVSVDPVLFEHVLINLVENAIKYGKDPFVITARCQDSHVELTVRDHGAGFPPGSEVRMFEKFFRVPGTRATGVGLGLAVCRGIVEAHRGTITADNAPDGGARFRVVLPAGDVPSSAAMRD